MFGPVAGIAAAACAGDMPRSPAAGALPGSGGMPTRARIGGWRKIIVCVMPMQFVEIQYTKTPLWNHAVAGTISTAMPFIKVFIIFVWQARGSTINERVVRI